MTGSERTRLAAAQRRLIETAATTDAPEDELAKAAAALDDITDRFTAFPPRPSKHPEMPDLDELPTFFQDDPISGRNNPLAPPVEITFGDSSAVGIVTFNRSYEGAPGFVHGGAIAAVFDQVLGMANLATGHPGMTGTLTIRYLNATPIEQEIRFEASAGDREGRKSFVTGRALVGGTVTAEAEGTFIIPSRKRAAEMFLGGAAPGG